MGVGIISLLLVLIEVSLGASFISGVFILSYLFYLIEKWEQWILLPITIIILIHSLQNRKISIVVLLIFLVSLVYSVILHYIEYNKEGILFFSIIQTLIIIFIFRKNISVAEVIYNFIGLNLANYFYIVQVKGKSGKI